MSLVVLVNVCGDWFMVLMSDWWKLIVGVSW